MDSIRDGTQEASQGVSGVIMVDEDKVRGHVDRVVRDTVQQTLNALLEAEADALCGAKRYERSPDRVDTRAGHYERKLGTKAGEVTLRVPKLRSLPFETAIIERYRRRESSVEEALVEMYLAGVARKQLAIRGIAFPDHTLHHDALKYEIVDSNGVKVVKGRMQVIPSDLHVWVRHRGSAVVAEELLASQSVTPRQYRLLIDTLNSEKGEAVRRRMQSGPSRRGSNILLALLSLGTVEQVGQELVLGQGPSSDASKDFTKYYRSWIRAVVNRDSSAQATSASNMIPLLPEVFPGLPSETYALMAIELTLLRADDVTKEGRAAAMAKPVTDLSNANSVSEYNIREWTNRRRMDELFSLRQARDRLTGQLGAVPVDGTQAEYHARLRLVVSRIEQAATQMDEAISELERHWEKNWEHELAWTRANIDAVLRKEEWWKYVPQ